MSNPEQAKMKESNSMLFQQLISLASGKVELVLIEWLRIEIDIIRAEPKMMGVYLNLLGKNVPLIKTIN